MEKIAIVTDSNSGLTPEDVKDTNVFVVPMPFVIDGEEFFENVTLTKDTFYNKVETGAEVSTSQPAIYAVKELWDELLKIYDKIIHIPMSSGLSQTCNASTNLSKDYDGKVFVVDNKRISATLLGSVMEAKYLVQQGKSAKKIVEYLNQSSLDSSIYITVSTLKYLKKGGRITPAGAMLGSLLNVKPVLQIQGSKLDAYAKVMGLQLAKVKMINALKADLEGRFKHLVDAGEITIATAHAKNDVMAEELKQTLKAQFPNIPFMEAELPLSIACHTGPGALGCGCFRTIYTKKKK